MKSLSIITAILFTAGLAFAQGEAPAAPAGETHAAEAMPAPAAKSKKDAAGKKKHKKKHGEEATH